MSRIKLMSVATAAFAVLAMGAGRAHAVDMPGLKATCEVQTVNNNGTITRQAKAKAKVTNGGANKAVSITWKIEVIKNGLVCQTITSTFIGTTDANGVLEADFGWHNLTPAFPNPPGGGEPPPPWTVKVTEDGTVGANPLPQAIDSKEISQ